MVHAFPPDRTLKKVKMKIMTRARPRDSKSGMGFKAQNSMELRPMGSYIPLLHRILYRLMYNPHPVCPNHLSEIPCLTLLHYRSFTLCPASSQRETYGWYRGRGQCQVDPPAQGFA